MNALRRLSSLSAPAACAALLAASVLAARAQDGAAEASAPDAGGHFTVPIDAPATRALDLSRSDGGERTVYDVTLEVPGRKIPLTARLPLEAGETAATLTLSVQEREGAAVSTLSLHSDEPGKLAEAPRLSLGLFSGKPVEVRLDRTDASAPARYRIEGAEDAPFTLSSEELAFAAGETTASFTVTANPSRAEGFNLRIVSADNPNDRLRLLLPVRRSPLAAFENNFYVCFIKKIPFGTREVRETAPDGTVTVRTEQVYKGRWHYITNGLRNTLSVALCAVVLGAILGFLAAIVRYTHDKHGHFVVLDAVAKTYITVIRGTPMTVQLLIAYFIIFSSINNKILVAILAFGFNSGAYVAEIIRAGIVSIDVGQMEAARSLGLSYGQGMRHVVLPQAIRNILPALGNEFIVMLKDTSIASFIGLDDLARGGSIIRSQTYQAYIPFLAVACIYLVLVMIFSKLLARLERHLQRSSR
jgi:His/Glu/Gln/Arg/opine family amino acid ABC transporter permease subunit